ncbi:hypothetical protein UVI_02017660 [Ustilaginoidea virens]|uniref:DUF7707 domain-containing protein n=1 Tax=Ustilaginoidea virens TaxID=1159556 RepID=A0A1B5KS37_USTVR|nr:hypothetical protein UVI_02017660 [Ustilaginoidea virens]
MPSPRSAVLAAAVFGAVASADYAIDPSSVSLGTRQSWCAQEQSTCPLICQQVEPRTTLVNTCDPVTLTFGCLCGNNQQPNVSEYSLSLPYFICQQWVQQCQNACDTNACKSDCTQNHPGAAIYTDAPGGGNDGKKGAAAALEAGRTYGLAAVLTGLFAGFALL